MVVRRKLNCKAFAVALTLFLLITLFGGCQSNPVQEPKSSFEPLNPPQIAQIDEAWQKSDMGKYPCPDLSSEDVYYGTHGDCVAIFYPGQLTAERTLEVAGVEITYGYFFNIYVYHSGTLCKLEEAYQNGLLTKENIEFIAKHHNDVHLILSDNPMFEELYEGTTEVSITNRYTNEEICRITDSDVVKKLQYAFNGWSFESAATEAMDLGCMYLVSFDDRLVIEFAEGQTYCRIDNKAYLLPEAFCELIDSYLPKT